MFYDMYIIHTNVQNCVYSEPTHGGKMNKQNADILRPTLGLYVNMYLFHKRVQFLFSIASITL